MFIYCDIFPDVQIMRVLSLGTDYRNDQIADCQAGSCYAGAILQLQPCCRPNSSVRTSGRSREWRHCSSLLAAPPWEANTPPLLHDSKVIHYDTKQRSLLASKGIILGHLREMWIYIGIRTYCMMWIVSFCLHCRRKWTFITTYLQTVAVISSSFYT